MRTKLNLLIILVASLILFLVCHLSVNAQSQNNANLGPKKTNKVVPLKVGANNTHQFFSSGNTDCQGKTTKIESKCEGNNKRTMSVIRPESSLNKNCTQADENVTKIEAKCEVDSKRMVRASSIVSSPNANETQAKGNVQTIEARCNTEHKRAASHPSSNSNAVNAKNEIVNINGTPITIVKTSMKKSAVTSKKSKPISSSQTNSKK